MVAARLVTGRRLHILHQPMLLDLQVRMRFAMGGSRHGVQHPYGARKALSFLRPRLAGTGVSDDRDHRSAGPDRLESAVEMAGPRHRRLGDVPRNGGYRGANTRVVRRVLVPLGLAEPMSHPAYLRFLWCLNHPTYYSLQWSSGWLLKSSTAAEADAGAVCEFPQISRFLPSFA